MLKKLRWVNIRKKELSTNPDFKDFQDYMIYFQNFKYFNIKALLNKFFMLIIFFFPLSKTRWNPFRKGTKQRH